MLCALLASASAVAAASISTSEIPFVPSFAGNHVVWIAERAGGGVELRRAQVGGRPETVQTFAPRIPFKPRFLVTTLAASDARALLVAHAYEGGFQGGPRSMYVDWFTGPPAGPLDRIDTCPGERYPGQVFTTLRSVDVSGSAYAYRRCDDGLGHVEIRDDGTPPLSPARAVGTGGAGARIAGRYVAWLDGGYGEQSPNNAADIVVYDRVDGTEVYRVPRAQIPGFVTSLDLQDDGKVAFTYALSAKHFFPRAVGWASAAEPRVHRLTAPANRLYDVRIGSDTIAYESESEFIASGRDTRIETSDLAGNARVVVTGADDYSSNEGFDFDGQRLLWRQLGCKRWRLVTHDVADGPVAFKPLHCKLRVFRRPVVKRGRVTLRLGCAPLARPCDFAVTLRTPKGRKVGSVEGRSPLRVPLTRYALTRLARRGVLRAQVRAVISDNDSREQTRSATVLLRR